MRTRPLALALLTVAFVATSGCSRPTARAPIVLISIDTLRADRLPVYGYRGVETPAIDALARDAMVFDEALAHYPMTLPSHVSLVTGLLPPRHGVRDNLGYSLDATRHPGLGRWLGERGYRSGGFVSSYVLRAATGLGAEFTDYDGPSTLPKELASMDLAQRPGTETASRAVAWMRAHREEPFLLFVHFYEPHAPYTPPAPFAGRYADPYDGEVAASDALVGTILGTLRELGLYDRAAIALVSDHGEGLGEHGEQQHGVFLYRSTLRVPFLLKLPKSQRAGERIARPVGLVDVAPTLAALAGAKPPAEIDGTDLLDPKSRAPVGQYAETYYPRLHFGWSELTAWTEARWSLVDGPQPELFDLSNDPGQLHNVLEAQRRELARTRGEARQRNLPLEAPAPADAETASRLASLGYLTGGSRATGPLPDPRAEREVLAQIEAGVRAFFDGDNETGVRLLSTVAQSHPAMLDVWSFLARSLDRLGRPAEALPAWEKVLELTGGDTAAALNVAQRHLALGHLERAAEVAESVKGAERSSVEELLTLIDVAAGRTEAAERRMERAVAEGFAGETMRRRLALLRLQRGDAAGATDLLEPFRAEGEPASLTLLALALAAQGRDAEGLPLLDRAKNESARPADFFENLGVATLALGRLDRAQAAFAEAVRLDPQLASAWNSLGVVTAQRGDRRAAVEAWGRATAIDAGLLDAWFNLGMVSAELGERAEAARALRRFLEGAQGPRFAADRARAQQAMVRLGASR